MSIKSPAAHRKTRFELLHLKPYGHSRGGLEITCVERSTGNVAVPLEMSSESLSDQSTSKQPAAGTLAERWIELLSDMEDLFAVAYQSTIPTIDDHAKLVNDANAARKAIESAKEEARVVEEERQANERASLVAAEAKSRAEKEHAELSAQIAKKRAELESLHANVSDAAKAEEAAKARLSAADVAHADTEAAHASIQAEISSTRADLRAIHETADAMILDKKATIDALHSHVEKVAAEASEVDAKLAAKKADLAALEATDEEKGGEVPSTNSEESVP